MAAEFYVYYEEPNAQGKMERHSIKCFDLRDLETYALERLLLEAEICGEEEHETE